MSGVRAGRTAISTTGPDDTDAHYRGYDIADLTRHCIFEEVAHLLVHGSLPSEEHLRDFRTRIANARSLPPRTQSVLNAIPRETHPMDVLRMGLSVLGVDDPEGAATAKNARAYGEKILAALPAMLFPARDPAHSEKDTIAEHFLSALHGGSVPAPHVRALNTALILYAEHEFATSTFAARLVTSTGANIYDSAIAALAALKGPKHGGALEDAFAVQRRYTSPEAAVADITARLAHKERIAGFGHPVYRKGDPRAAIIKEEARALANSASAQNHFAIADAIETAIGERKGLHPNIDWYSALVFHLLGVPPPMFTCLFAFGRMAGWTAHIAEQREENTLLRPAADYTGPGPRAFASLADR